jgi:hypothetical protein
MVPTAPQEPPTEEERAVSRNITEVPDPDAGTVVHFDPALALWDRVRGAWRWETYEAPPEYTLVHVVTSRPASYAHPDRGITHPRARDVASDERVTSLPAPLRT